MASLRTEITEITTGLGMLGMGSVDEALAACPEAMVGVEAQQYDRLIDARAQGRYEAQFEEAWANGVAFAAAESGLRGRKPMRVEWKGAHQAPSYEQIPADLRVDHVYLVSCKYGSRLLHNVSPAHLFERLLATRRREAGDWYLKVAPTEYQALYEATRQYLVDQEDGFDDLPPKVTDLSVDQHKRLKKPLARRWPEPVAEAAHWFSVEVARASAEQWLSALGSRLADREEALWRLLRLQAAPYFVLGTDRRHRSVRYRVDTPWDFRQRYAFKSLDVWPEVRAQPVVRWRGDLILRADDAPVHVDGHVEVRWSHGRFQGLPEAKVYLKTHYRETPGYNELL